MGIAGGPRHSWDVSSTAREGVLRLQLNLNKLIIDPYLIIGTLSGSHSFDTLRYVLFLAGLHTAELHGTLGVICPEGTLLFEVCLVESEIVIPQQGL